MNMNDSTQKQRFGLAHERLANPGRMTRRLRAKGARRYVPIALSLGLLAAACGKSTDPSTGNPLRQGSTAAALTEGWNLVSTKASTAVDFLQSLPDSQWAAWGIDHAFDNHTGRVTTSYHQAAKLNRNQSYWVYLAPQGAIADASELIPPTLPVGPTSWGQVLDPTAPLSRSPAEAREVLTWDALAQTLVPVEGKLEPGQAYWIVREALCTPGKWSFQDATDLIAGCPLEGSSARVLALPESPHQGGASWSLDVPQTSATRVVLHQTGTDGSLGVQSLAEKKGHPDTPDFHFVVAKDDTGSWQIYAGVPVAEDATDLHIAIAGTYEPKSEAHPEETEFGYLSNAEERDQQPEPGAVIRLLQLHSALFSQNETLTSVVPYGQGVEAMSPGASLSPGRATLHLVGALKHRFAPSGTTESPQKTEADLFAQADLKAAVNEAISTPVDSRAPMLFVATPNRENTYTEAESFLVSGEVYDEDLTELSVNGVVIAYRSQSFSAPIWLEPGQNIVTLVAQDAAGQRTEVVRRIVLDDGPPLIEVSLPGATELAEDDTIRVFGRVVEDHLESFTINGQPIDLIGGRFERAFSKKTLTEGLYPLELQATDALGHQSTQSLGLLVDENGPVFLPDLDGLDASSRPSTDESPIGFFVDVVATEADTDAAIVVTDGAGQTETLPLSSLLENGASPEWKRAYVFFEELKNVKTEDIDSIEVEGVTPESSELSWKITRFSAKDAPRAPGSDPIMPVLWVEEPGQETRFTNRPIIKVSGLVDDTHFVSLRVNQVVVATSTGAFQGFMKLTAGENQLTFVARDHSENEVQVTRTVVLDRVSPTITFDQGLEATVYASEIKLTGFIDDAHFSHAVLTNEATSKEKRVDATDGRFGVLVSLTEGLNRFKLVAFDLAGNATSASLELQYRTTPFESTQPTLAPRDFVAWAERDTVHLRWKAPTRLVDGGPIPSGVELSYRIFRNGEPVEDVYEPRYEGTGLPVPGTYSFHVTALIAGKEGTEHSSERSSQAHLELKVDAPIVPKDGFEPPSAVSPLGTNTRLPVMATSHQGLNVYTHLAYAAHEAHPSGGDEVRIVRSDKLAKNNSWSDGLSLTQDGGWTVTDLSLTAQGRWVLAAWIEAKKDGAPHQSRVQVAVSADGGLSFGAPKPIRENESWKHGIDIDIDRFGASHLVWGESGKAYYLKNLSGEPASVFDIRRRALAAERVKYKALYEPRADGSCDCPDCWCEESYSVLENPAEGHEAQGKYLVRTEEAHVLQPSLHVDQNALTIIAHQKRVWDNNLVPHPAWFDMYETPVYSDTIVQRRLPTRLVVGWRNTWKKAYEPGDESLWAQLGIQYQYRYQGTWHENDQIRVAQRPLAEGAWASHDLPEGQVWRQGEWKDDVEQAWRISVVHERAEADRQAPARPKVFTAPSGQMVAVFEKGASTDPNQQGSNAIHVSYSDDGGLRWTPSTHIATGYVPDLAISSNGTMGVVYYAAHEDPKDAKIEVVRNRDGQEWDLHTSVHAHPPEIVHWKNHGPEGGTLRNVPSLVSHDALMMAAWVRAAVDESDGVRVVTTRGGTPATESKAVHVTTPSVVSAHQSAPVEIECVNQFYMQTDGCTDQRPVQLLSASSIAPEALDDLERSRTVWTEFKPQGSSHTALATGSNRQSAAIPSTLEPASASEPANPEATHEAHPHATGEVHLASDTAQAPHQESALLSGAPLTTAEGSIEIPDVLPGEIEGNYLKAKLLIDKLYDPGLGAQREYDGDPGDADYASLVRFGRVWAYTQGIALAQFARHNDPRAPMLANFICDTARPAGAGNATGWPFSWNTDGDNWKDARMVTGANSWVVHGLGVFMTSSQFSDYASSEKLRYHECYDGALGGVGLHFDREIHLVTAGTTAAGLRNANQPSKLIPLENPNEAWAYYGILDAIGYEDFDSENPPLIQTFESPGGIKGRVHTLTESEFHALKEPQKALNIVTEHNLDALSVLNHHLAHFQALGGAERDLEQGLDARQDSAERKELWSELRNNLNNAIFTHLWDDTEGRVVTGGTITGQGGIEPSHHTAIDNCSWLSLSVNYAELSDDHRDKLSRCLDYTIRHFVKMLEFSGKLYYGTHYFPQAFKDPYIEENPNNERLYHLEATTGMILGLLRFADANPKDPRTKNFRDEANKMWRHMQVFVRDHGFPYSTYKIQDLMTQLDSSTAAIWFIDVYDYYASHELDLDRPLKNYAQDLDLQELAKDVQHSASTLKLGGSVDQAQTLILHATGQPKAEGQTPGRPRGEVAKSLLLDGEAFSDYEVRLLMGPDRRAEYSLDEQTWDTVPVNAANITLDIDRVRRHGGGLLDDFTDYFWPTVTVFRGSISAWSFLGEPSNYRVLLSIVRGEEERLRSVVEPRATQNGKWMFSGAAKAIDADHFVARLATVDAKTGTYTLLAATGEPVQQPNNTIYTGHVGEWSFHRPYPDGFHVYQLIQKSTGEVVDQIDETQLSQGLVLSAEIPLPQTEEGMLPSVRATFVHDQALAILAALSAGDVPLAENRADALTNLVQWETNPELARTLAEQGLASDLTLAQFPFAVYTGSGQIMASYFQTGSQLLAIYALAQLVPHTTRERQDFILRLCSEVLESIQIIYRNPDGPFLYSGSGDPGILTLLVPNLPAPEEPLPDTSVSFLALPKFPVASLEDHVYGYFAANALSSQFVGGELRIDAAQLASSIRFANAIQQFWHEGQPRPFVALLDSGPSPSGSSLRAAALYTLYALHHRTPFANQDDESVGEFIDAAKAKRSIEILGLLDSGDQPKAIHTGLPDLALVALARRRASVLDPRLEALAWYDLQKLIVLKKGYESHAENMGSLAGHVLVDEPAGFLGVQSSSFLELGQDPQEDLLAPLMDLRLDTAYYDALWVLLAADFRPHTFESLLGQISRIRYLVDAIRNEVPRSEWRNQYANLPYSDRIVATIYELTHLCEGNTSVVGGFRDDIQAKLGVSCSAVSAHAQDWVDRWTQGDDPNLVANQIEHADDMFLLTELIQQVTVTQRSPENATHDAFFGFPTDTEHSLTIYDTLGASPCRPRAPVRTGCEATSEPAARISSENLGSSCRLSASSSSTNSTGSIWFPWKTPPRPNTGAGRPSN